MGKTQPTEKLREPEKGVGVDLREKRRKEGGETLRKILGFLPWVSGPWCNAGNARWTIHKLQLVAMPYLSLPRSHAGIVLL